MSDIILWQPYVTPERVSGVILLERRVALTGNKTVCLLCPLLLIIKMEWAHQRNPCLKDKPPLPNLWVFACSKWLCDQHLNNRCVWLLKCTWRSGLCCIRGTEKNKKIKKDLTCWWWKVMQIPPNTKILKTSSDFQHHWFSYQDSLLPRCRTAVKAVFGCCHKLRTDKD